MNLPSKIKIVKSHDGLPPVGTVMKHIEVGNNIYSGECDGVIYANDALSISLALEAGYAEPVVDAMPQWQVWERNDYNSFFIGQWMKVESTLETEYPGWYWDIGNYFPSEKLATQARDRILETLKQFHKEHKTQ
jgi:hypothetical protein